MIVACYAYTMLRRRHCYADAHDTPYIFMITRHAMLIIITFCLRFMMLRVTPYAAAAMPDADY